MSLMYLNPDALRSVVGGFLDASGLTVTSPSGAPIRISNDPATAYSALCATLAEADGILPRHTLGESSSTLPVALGDGFTLTQNQDFASHHNQPDQSVKVRRLYVPQNLREGFAQVHVTKATDAQERGVYGLHVSHRDNYAYVKRSQRVRHDGCYGIIAEPVRTAVKFKRGLANVIWLGKWLERLNSISDVFSGDTRKFESHFPEMRRRRDALIHLHNVETALKITTQILAGLPGTTGFDSIVQSGLLFVDGESDVILARIPVNEKGQLDLPENAARILVRKNPSHHFKIVFGDYYSPPLSVASAGIDAPIEICIIPSNIFPDLSKSSGVINLVDLVLQAIQA